MAGSWAASDFDLMLADAERREKQLDEKVAQRTRELEHRDLELRNEIAERIKTEEMLVRSEQGFKSTFDSAAIGMFLRHQDRAFVRVNRAFSSMLGYEPAELEGVPVVDLTHSDDHELGKDQYRRLRAGEIDRYQIEKRYLHKDGRVIWALCHVTVVSDDHNHYEHAIVQVIDITEAHQL